MSHLRASATPQPGYPGVAWPCTFLCSLCTRGARSHSPPSGLACWRPPWREEKWSSLLAQFERQLKRCKSIYRHSINEWRRHFLISSVRWWLAVCACVCVCLPLKSATRSTPQVPQHALITINGATRWGRRVRWLWWQHLEGQASAAPTPPATPRSPYLPPPNLPVKLQPQLVAQVGQAQNLSPIIVDIVYGCQRPLPAIAFDLPTPFAMTINPVSVTQSLSQSLPCLAVSLPPQRVVI